MIDAILAVHAFELSVDHPDPASGALGASASDSLIQRVEFAATNWDHPGKKTGFLHPCRVGAAAAGFEVVGKDGSDHDTVYRLRLLSPEERLAAIDAAIVATGHRPSEREASASTKLYREVAHVLELRRTAEEALARAKEAPVLVAEVEPEASPAVLAEMAASISSLETHKETYIETHKDTKIPEASVSAAPRKRGRPCKGERPMTTAERTKAMRERRALLGVYVDVPSEDAKRSVQRLAAALRSGDPAKARQLKAILEKIDALA